MKRLVAVPAVLLVLAVVPVVVAPPAHAKGATDVVVSGPGIDDVRLGYTRRMGDVDVGSLAEVSGIYLIFGAAIGADDPGLTRTELGPRYTLTWHQGSAVMAVSHVYPFATQGAWMHISDEPSGWVRGGPDLADAMVSLGARQPTIGDLTAPTDATTTADPVAATTPADPASSRPSPRTAGVVAALAALLLGAGVWLVRRRRTPHPVLTLSG